MAPALLDIPLELPARRQTIEPYIRVNPAISSTGYGIRSVESPALWREGVEVRPPPPKSPGDIKKLQCPQLIINNEETALQIEHAADFFWGYFGYPPYPKPSGQHKPGEHALPPPGFGVGHDRHGRSSRVAARDTGVSDGQRRRPLGRGGWSELAHGGLDSMDTLYLDRATCYTRS